MSEGTRAPIGAMPRDPINHPELYPVDEIERLLLAKQEDVTLLCKTDTTIIYVSPSVTRVLGYQPEEVAGHPFSDFLHPNDVAAIADDWGRFISEGEGNAVEFRIRHKDGSWSWYEARSSNADDERFPGCACVNICEIEHLHRLRQRVATAEEMAKVGSWRWILREGEPVWSQSHYTMLGYEPGDGQVDPGWPLELYHPDDHERVGKLVVDCLVEPEPFTVVVRVASADGVYRSIIQHCFAETDAAGEVVAIVGICQDISAQIEAENALRRSERTYRVLAEEASDLIMRYNKEGVCTFASTASLSILGYEPDDIEGKTALGFIHLDDQHIIRGIYEASLGGKVAQRVTYRAHHKEGRDVWLEASIRTIFDAEGKISEIIAVARDVTERWEIEESLKAAREKAEAASSTKSMFLANMSHELRTPLNAIIGFSDIMREEMFGPVGCEQYTDYTRLIHESGQFLLDLINDILDMSKIEAGKYDLFIEEVDLETVVKNCVRIVEPRADPGAIAFSCKIDDDLPFIPADERAVKQILLNLLSNAVKFTPKGGTIEVRAERRDGAAWVCVSDNGCGIPAAAIPRLANPFEQVRPQAGPTQAGTGLGLALVKSFVELHGGVLSIESVEGEGTSIAFTLPLERQVQAKTA